MSNKTVKELMEECDNNTGSIYMDFKNVKGGLELRTEIKKVSRKMMIEGATVIINTIAEKDGIHVTEVLKEISIDLMIKEAIKGNKKD